MSRENQKKDFDEEDDDELIDEGTIEKMLNASNRQDPPKSAGKLAGNPFYVGPEDDFFGALLGQRGGVLAQRIATVMNEDVWLIDEVPLEEFVHTLHPPSVCLFMPNAVRGRGHHHYRSVYCVDLRHPECSWVGSSLEEQFQRLSIYLHGDLMNTAIDRERDWKGMLPEELIIITNCWETDTADWLPMLRAWNKLLKSVELYLVMPGIATRIKL